VNGTKGSESFPFFMPIDKVKCFEFAGLFLRFFAELCRCFRAAVVAPAGGHD
jgi:hypothetical protein